MPNDPIKAALSNEEVVKQVYPDAGFDSLDGTDAVYSNISGADTYLLM